VIDDILEVSSEPSTNARLLCRGVDTDENKVGLLNSTVYVRGKE
jgi:hypothetical protein